MANLALTQLLVKNAKPKATGYKLSDGNGAYLYVSKSGVKSWRIDYRFNGKRLTATLGRFPELSLSEFRERVLAFRKMLFDGIDPVAKKQEKTTEQTMTYSVMVAEWLSKKKKAWTERYARQVEYRINNDELPFIGEIPIKAITRLQCKNVVERVENRGALEIARRVAQDLECVLQYAVNCGYLEFNVAFKIMDILGKRPPVDHRHAETDPAAFGALLRRIDSFSGASFPVKCALQIMPLLVVRSKELRAAKWEEFDFEKALWVIPAERMKMRKQHAVPLSRQVLQILQKLKDCAMSVYVFPSKNIHSAHISDNGLLFALKKVGGEGLHIHGFRGTFSTLCRENRFAPNDIIELCLSHTVGNQVEQAYNHAELLQERRELMQRWADYCDKLKKEQSG